MPSIIPPIIFGATCFLSLAIIFYIGPLKMASRLISNQTAQPVRELSYPPENANWIDHLFFVLSNHGVDAMVAIGDEILYVIFVHHLINLAFWLVRREIQRYNDRCDIEPTGRLEAIESIRFDDTSKTRRNGWHVGFGILHMRNRQRDAGFGFGKDIGYLYLCFGVG
ncbi:hypothetical protein N7457_008057 [Penicillium paradoxum]|uniref:uncharacterized protein n=1 Tax=Penicillium paradoxum TaxID=176176 RepID=UPI002546B661|nr:uncharacterized protein N7457_008057 [Penicillium paradoxum]KAJ5773161.1 hypothetical protein N7457_008057 [Penicillium paradoxum]